jgi:hypothetical protein
MAATDPAALRPVVLIGAARSGTRLLRDLLGGLPGVDVVPHDVNFLWRRGNEAWPHDALPARLATPPVAAGVRRKLAGFGRPGRTLVEKTVSNALRVPFVDAVLPGARYVHLVRDGRDVVASAVRQWTAGPDWRRLLRKAWETRSVVDPGYLLRRFRRRGGPDGAPRVWGPAYEGVEEDLACCSLLEVCARQWVACVVEGRRGLAGLAPERVVEVRYEALVARPAEELGRIAAHLGLDPAGIDPELTGRVSPDHVGKGRGLFEGRDGEAALERMEPVLEEMGYPAGDLRA